jgi:hypothetical protein
MTDIDHDLYDRVMAKYSPVSVREGHALYEEGRRAGYHQATVEAARISDERQHSFDTEQLLNRIVDAMPVRILETWHPDYWRAEVRAAIRPVIEAAKENDHE